VRIIAADLILFDLDGTLVDSSHDIAHAANHTLEHMGYARRDIEAIKADIGWGVKVLLERLMPDEPPERINHARRSFLDFYGERLVVETVLYPGVRQTLDGFVAAGKKMAVVTNKPEALSRRLLDELDLSRYFKAVVGGDTLTVRKPSPEPVRTAIQAAGGVKESAVMVGDSPVDAEAGAGAGVATIGVTYGYRGREELTGFDILLDGFSELKDVIK